MNRRQFLAGSAAAAAARGGLKAADEGFRFVHFTDTHIQRELKADEGVAKAFTQIARLQPDFCLAGGDLVFDVLESRKPRAKELFALYGEAVKRLECPVHSAPGNHDYFGVFKKSGVSPKDPEYGKKMFEDRIGPRYKSFDHKGWHFITLDTVFIEGRKYKGYVDDEQLSWLKADLEKNGPGKPVIVLCHIPLVTAALQVVPGWQALGNAIVVENAAVVVELFDGYPVKLVLQGHTHINERVRWKNTDYITTGAVSGNWWKGPRMGFPEGYAVIEAAGDQVSWRFESYGWTPVAKL
ncbi:MAG: metallophosphoesterase [Bryobacteraceae bacterium]|nr:metallophosphoesterase [Bryobacteraceae bacterium]